MPDIDDLLNTRYKPEEADDFVNIFNYVKEHKNVDQSRIGFIGFCLGSSVALLAAENPQIANEVSFVSTAALLYDLKTLSRDAMTETVFDASPPHQWTPDPKTKQVVITEFTDYLPDPQEHQLISEALLNEDSLTAEEISNLSLDAHAIYNYLHNKNPEQSAMLWEMLPQGGKERLAKLSPKTKIENLKAKTFIIPGNEKYLPSTEAENLAKDLPENQVVFSNVNSFAHTEFVFGNSLSEKARDSARLITHLTKFILHTKPFARK
jgi:dienelactone hydrolase